jgi:hypothetical protein
MTTPIGIATNDIGDTVFETRTGKDGREWWIVAAAHTSCALFYVRPARWKDENECSGTLKSLKACREEFEAK